VLLEAHAKIIDGRPRWQLVDLTCEAPRDYLDLGRGAHEEPSELD
jgi:hypothetical protein